MIYNKQDGFRDGRWLLLTLLLMYFSVLVVAELFFGAYDKIWKLFGVNSVRSFIDLKVLLCGIEEYLDGHNPYMWIKCTYNYPLLWCLFAYIPYFSTTYFIQMGIFLLILFFSSILFFFGKITFRVALIYGGLLLSPSVMLAVERGNCDIIIFLFLLSSLVFLSKNFHRAYYLLLFFSSFLKLFPIFGFISLLEVVKSKKKLFWIIFVTVVIFICYLLLIQKQLIAIYEIHPKMYFLSYGLFTLPIYIFKTTSLFDLKTLKVIASIFLVIVVSFLVTFRKKTSKNKELYKAEAFFFNSYLMGSSIFVGTFILGNNYDYRLIFLVFTFPQLIHWVHIPDLRKYSLFHFFLLLLVLWNPLISGIFTHVFHTKFIIYLVEEVVCWLLFYLYLKFLVHFILQTFRIQLLLNLCKF